MRSATQHFMIHHQFLHCRSLLTVFVAVVRTVTCVLCTVHINGASIMSV
jgi:hypothetical protein